MKSRPRFTELLSIEGLKVLFTNGWKAWFQDVYDALAGWNSVLTGAGTINFGNIPIGSELAGTVSVAGASPGDFVIVRPSANMVGIIFTADVTGAGVVTVHAKNFSTDFIDPPPIDFKFIILQN